MAASAKEHLWLSCREKTCCSFYNVFPTGHDIWRIATQLRMPPWSFTTPLQAAAEAEDGIVLSPDGSRFRVALAKQTTEEPFPPCVFLMKLSHDAARCGLGELRPRPCHSFPSMLADGLLYLMNDGGCSCRTWSLADVDVDHETELLAEEQRERIIYQKVIASWNEYVSGTGDVNLSYRDFCRYLLDIYTSINEQEV
jgi:Fe-S-cluster containining protein